MSKLWNLIEEHYLIAAFLVWVIVGSLARVVQSLLRAIQLHPDYITHNHYHRVGAEEDDDDDDEDEDNSLPLSSSDPMLTRPRPQSIPRPGGRAETAPKLGLLTRAERVIRNLRN